MADRPTVPAPAAPADETARARQQYPNTPELWGGAPLETPQAGYGGYRGPEAAPPAPAAPVQTIAPAKPAEVPAALAQFKVDRALQENWRSATRADAEIGGAQLDAALRDSAGLVGEFGNEKLQQIFSGPMADHPEVIRFLTKVSRALATARKGRSK